MKADERDEESVQTTQRFLVLTTPNSPMTAKVHELYISFNIPLQSYHAILCEFDETYSSLNDMLISMSSDAETSKASLYEAHNILEENKSNIESSVLYITNLMYDRDSLRIDNQMLVAQRNIYCNTAKRLYDKLIDLYHSTDIFIEQHRKLLPFITFKR